MTTFGSVCSGIEAASVAWEPLGFVPAWFSEIEPYPCKLLAKRYPNVINMGDMTKLAEYVRAGFIAAPDVLVGGTPCQAFSVAGLRNSLDDERGQLSISFIGLANAIDEQRNKDDECIITWENVPGVLTTKDNAFGCFLAGLAGESGELHAPGGKWPNAGCVYGPQRAVAWRVLDAQYFGVAQRRRRVFVVASARKGFDPAGSLFEFEGLRRDIAPSRQSGEKVAGTITTSVGKCDQAGSVADQLVYSMSASNSCEVNVAPTIDCNVKNGPMQAQTACGIVTANRMVAFGEYVDDGTASTMKARDYKDATDLVVTTTQFGSEIAGTLTARHDSSPCADRGQNVVAYGIPGNWIGRAPENGGNATEPMNNIAPCLTKTDRHAVACEPIVLPINTMTVQGRPSDDLNPRMGSGIGSPTDPQNTLTKAHMHGVFDSQTMSVRRLTPRECERLQGFPDDYTLIPGASNSARYKALGNSMAVPVMHWIGKQIKLALDSGK